MSKEFHFAEFEDPNRCSYCREPISEEDQKNGMVLHVKVAPRKALDPATGKVLGFLQPDGPKNRYLHGRPCGEKYCQGKLVCDNCDYWRAANRGSGLCLCLCHPPKNSDTCAYFEKDLERAGGK